MLLSIECAFIEHRSILQGQAKLGNCGTHVIVNIGEDYTRLITDGAVVDQVQHLL